LKGLQVSEDFNTMWAF